MRAERDGTSGGNAHGRDEHKKRGTYSLSKDQHPGRHLRFSRACHGPREVQSLIEEMSLLFIKVHLLSVLKNVLA
jgi:hypothetical protein